MTQAKPKIVIVTHEFSPFRGGVAAYSEELAIALHRAGNAVEVWAPDCGRTGASEVVPFPVARLGAGGSMRAGDMIRLARQLLARRAQLAGTTVILTSGGSHVAFMALVPLGVVKYERLISVLHGSEILRFQRNWFWRYFGPRLFQRVDRVVTVSKFSKSLIEQTSLSRFMREIIIAPPACSTAATRPCATAKMGDGKIRILTLARVQPRKGQLDTARALALLPAELRSRIIYQVGGIGNTLYLEQVVAVCGDATVAFEHLGEIGPEALAATYQQSDICAMTSRSLPNSVEGFGISYLEAGFHRKPVVAYRSGGAVEAVLDGETGLLVEEGDIAGLTNAFQRLLADPALCQQLGEGGRRHAVRFSWDTTAQLILNGRENKT